MTDHGESGAAGNGGPVAAEEATWAERMHWRRLGLLMDLNEAFPLPDCMYFDIEDGPDDQVPPGHFRAAAGNLVREDDPLVIAFRAMVDRFGEIFRALDPLAALHRQRVSAMHRDYRRRQLARRRRR